ncbi:uncharacterized protein LOC127291628 [Leptopilina boulardi]|uniref:uncharacterized protein LOC127291628 n=1 Tax=Leptopilina boulardi TaxID=63433 RepID=UPI0021F52DFD|nr:uncharacterized protein LOC127291628 [Leptopilina boulardi]
MGYWEDNQHQYLYINDCEVTNGEVKFITLEDCNNILKVVKMLQQGDCMLPGNNDISLRKIRSIISQVFRNIRNSMNQSVSSAEDDRTEVDEIEEVDHAVNRMLAPDRMSTNNQ